MAYFDDGPDGRRRRLLLPPPPVGREETALVCKLFRLSRDLTALRVHRCVSVEVMGRAPRFRVGGWVRLRYTAGKVVGGGYK